MLAGSHTDTGRVCAKYFVWSGTGMEWTPSSTSLFRYCIRWSGTGSGSGCALAFVPDLSYRAVAIWDY